LGGFIKLPGQFSIVGWFIPILHSWLGNSTRFGWSLQGGALFVSAVCALCSPRDARGLCASFDALFIVYGDYIASPLSFGPCNPPYGRLAQPLAMQTPGQRDRERDGEREPSLLVYSVVVSLASAYRHLRPIEVCVRVFSEHKWRQANALGIS